MCIRDSRRAHVEPAEQLPLFDIDGVISQVDTLDDSGVPRPYLAGPRRRNTANVERADEDQRCRACRCFKIQNQALITSKQPANRRRGCGVDTEQVAGHVEPGHQFAREWSMHAVIVVWREIDRRKRTVGKRMGLLQINREQVVQRVFDTCLLYTSDAADE